MRAYRVEKSIDTVWKTGGALLACVGPRPGSEHVVRSTARLAGQLGADWHAVYVETPALQRLPAAQRERILRTLKLAQELGASTAVLAGDDIGAGHRRLCARATTCRRSCMGARPPHLAVARSAHRGGSPRWRPISTWSRSAQRRHRRRAAPAGAPPRPGLRRAQAPPGVAYAVPRRQQPGHGACWRRRLLPYLDLANIVMLFLLVVVLVAVRLGRGASVVATCVGVACFDFFFVPPRFSFAVSRPAVHRHLRRHAGGRPDHRRT